MLSAMVRRPPPLGLLAIVCLLGAVACRPNTIVAVGVAAGTDAAPGEDNEEDAGTRVPEEDAAEDAGEPDAAESDGAGPDGPRLPERGLVGYWPLDDGSGARVQDHSGHGNHGTLERGDPIRAWGPGRVGGALDLSGGAWVNVPSAPAIDAPASSNAITIAAWLWAVSYTPGEFNFVVSRQIGATPYDSYGLALRDGRPVLALVSDFPGGAARVPLRRWVHLAASFDGTVGRVYVDGVQVASQTVRQRISSETRPLLIGGNQNDATGRPKEFFEGFVDEVRLYRRALSSQEIALLAR